MADGYREELMELAEEIDQLIVKKWDYNRASAGDTNSYGLNDSGGPPANFSSTSESATVLLQPYAELPDPSGFDEIIEELKKICGGGPFPEDESYKIDEVGGDFSELGGWVNEVDEKVQDGWTGLAASSFSRSFNDYEKVVPKQAAAAKVFALNTVANRGLIKSARDDAKKAAESARTALESLESEGAAPAVAFTLSIVIAATGIAAAFVTGGTSLGLAVTGGAAITANGLLSAKGQAEAERGEAEAIGGADVLEIRDKLKSNLDTIQTHIQDSEEHIVESLNSITNQLTTASEDYIGTRPRGMVDKPEEAHKEFNPPSHRSSG